MDGDRILCRTRLEEAERHLREFVSSEAEEKEARCRASEALAHLRKALEILRTKEPAETPPR